MNKLEEEKDIKLFTSEPDRIVVLDLDNEDAESWTRLYREWETKPSEIGMTCYNLKKLGRYGICKTGINEYPFGFCGPSCKINLPRDVWKSIGSPKLHRVYHEMEATLYNAKPEESKLMNDCNKIN